MCWGHHAQADGGAWSHDELQAMKHRQPDVAAAGEFGYRLDQLIRRGGGLMGVRTPVLLEIAGRNVIWLSNDEHGRQLLNLDVWGLSGELSFAMRDNEWVVVAPIDDLEC
jgi:hypothetical protein